MSLPPSDVVQGIGDLLAAKGLAQEVTDRRPDLGEFVSASETRPVVQLLLPDRVRRIVCARVTHGRRSGWIVVAPDSPDDPTDAWRKHSARDQLADQMIEAYDRFSS